MPVPAFCWTEVHWAVLHECRSESTHYHRRSQSRGAKRGRQRQVHLHEVSWNHARQTHEEDQRCLVAIELHVEFFLGLLLCLDNR